MSAKTTGPSGDLSDVFAAEAPRCGFGGLFDESLLARRFDRLFTHHRARLEASIAGIDRAREAVKPLGVALTFAASGYPVNDGYPPRGPGRKRDWPGLAKEAREFVASVSVRKGRRAATRR